MRVPASLLVHQVTVTPATGHGAYGDTYGEPFPLRCFAEGGTKLVRDRDGNEVVATLSLITDPGRAADVPPGSLVAWEGRPGRESTVLSSVNHDSGGLGAPDHTEVVCE